MNKSYKVKIILWVLIILSILQCKKEKKENIILKKEYYIVIDTSGSMAFGPFSKIQKNFKELLTLIDPGDSLVLVSFDSQPKIIKKIDEFNLEQQEEVVDLVQKLKPQGLYTDFYALLNFLKDLIKESKEEIYEEEEYIKKIQKKQYIIILTDGIDDPKDKRSLIDLKDYEGEEPLPVKDKYIYYISFASKKSEQLEKGLESISPNVKTIERSEEHMKNTSDKNLNASNELANKDIIGVEEIKQDILQREEESGLWDFKQYVNFIRNNLILLGVFIILFLIIFLFLFKKYKPQPLKGELIYYRVGDHPSMAKTVKLSRFEKKKLSIGNDPACLIKIREKDFPRKIDLVALDKREGFMFRVPRKFTREIQILSSKESKQNIIHSGDKFKIKNYIFEYSYGNKYKNV